MTPLERMNVRLARATLRVRWINRLCSWFQRVPSTMWVGYVCRKVLHVHGTERLGPVPELPPMLMVANHRSYFDFFLIALSLSLRGLPHRFTFPVRSRFFYDRPLGFLLNAAMSACSMYPPIFRGEDREQDNSDSIEEMVRILRDGDGCVGIHPEGRRKRVGDPYELLPVRSGVGRVAISSGAMVVPVFINGLRNDFLRQSGQFLRGEGGPVIVVFGEPMELSDLSADGPTRAACRDVAERCKARIEELGEEERKLRETIATQPGQRAAG